MLNLKFGNLQNDLVDRRQSPPEHNGMSDG